MKVSDKLQSQLDRLKKTGAFAIGQTEKKELSGLIDEIGGRPYSNFGCGTCTRNAMHEMITYQDQKESVPVLQFKGVKDPEDMTYQELKKACKDKGVKAGRVNKSKLIELLKG